MSAQHRRVSVETAAFIRAQREQLFRAAAVVTVVKYANVSTLDGLSADTVADALDCAYRLIDAVAAALEPLGLDSRE